MKTILAMGAALMLAAAAGDAHAWMKVKNNTPNTIWFVHAFASTSGFGCGYDDGCTGENGEWAVQHWWGVAPGGTATVQSQNFGNAWHQYYAEDDFGHFWAGDGENVCLWWNGNGMCSDLCDTNAYTQVNLRRLRDTRCCGLGCSPDNYTLTLTL
jgi:uncharacterized membrane protein